jgi:hypothetical protein
MIKLRPSAASRWLSCPASVRLCADIPYTPAGEAAQIGTAIHEVAETAFLTNSSPYDWVGKTIKDIVITEQNADFAAAHVNHIRDLELRLGTLKVEQYVTVYKDKDIELGGTADVVAWNDEKSTLVIADLKTGRGYVDADSDQMKIYAIGAMRHAKIEFSNIELSIIQPHHGEPRTHKITFKELNDWAETQLTPAIQAIKRGDTEPTPTEDGCQWCPAKAICPAQRKGFEVIASQPDLTQLNKEDIKSIMVTLSPEQIEDLLDRAPLVEKFIDAVRAHAVTRIEAGEVIKGWQMQPKRAYRKWINEADAKNQLHDAGIPADQLVSSELISPSEASKLLSKEHKDLIDKLTAKVSSGLTLARDYSLGQ